LNAARSCERAAAVFQPLHQEKLRTFTHEKKRLCYNKAYADYNNAGAAAEVSAGRKPMAIEPLCARMNVAIGSAAGKAWPVNRMMPWCIIRWRCLRMRERDMNGDQQFILALLGLVAAVIIGHRALELLWEIWKTRKR